MAIKFNHQNAILVLRDEFSKFFTAHSNIRIRWGDSFVENGFRKAYILGEKKNEIKVLQTEILDGLNSIPVKFTENALGELTIEVNGKAIYTMKRDELICKDLLRAFAHSIKEEIQ
jgi:hypothetical protein